MHRLTRYTTTLALAVLSTVSLPAEFLVVDWSFNTAFNPGLASIDNVMGGSANEVTGGFFPFTPSVGVQIGSPGDTAPQEIVGGSPHNGRIGRSGPLADGTEASGTRKLGALASTDGYYGITVSWHAAQGYRASRYYQLYVTYDGVTYAPVSGGTGGSASVFGINGQTSSVASVDDTGLITFIVDDGVIRSNSDGDGFVYEFSYTFPAGPADNNPNFGFNIAAVHDPSGSDYVSSFAGTTGLADAESGYIRSDIAGGSSIFYDSIQITAAEAVFTWAGYPVAEDGTVNTFGWLQILYVAEAPYIYSYSLENWLYIDESVVTASGGWVYALNFGE